MSAAAQAAVDFKLSHYPMSFGAEAGRSTIRTVPRPASALASASRHRRSVQVSMTDLLRGISSSLR